jgi:hypothetical protein
VDRLQRALRRYVLHSFVCSRVGGIEQWLGTDIWRLNQLDWRRGGVGSRAEHRRDALVARAAQSRQITVDFASKSLVGPMMERPRYGRDEMKRMEAERCGAHRRRHRIRSSLRIFRDGSVRGAAVAARPKISRWRSDDTEARGECHQHKAGADAGILQPFRGFL